MNILNKYTNILTHTYTYPDPIFQEAYIRTYQLNQNLQKEIIKQYGWDKIEKIDNINSTNDELHYITIEGKNLVGVAEPGYKENSTQAKRKIIKALHNFIEQLSMS